MTASVNTLPEALRYYRAGDFAKALSLCREALARDGGDVDALQAAALCARALRDHRLAVEMIDRAARLRPRDAAVLELRGSILMEAGDLAGAVEAFRGALAVDAGRVDALRNLGSALTALDRPAEALSCLAQARDRAPRRPDVVFALANALRRAGRKAEAAGCLAEVIDLAPRDPGAHINLGALLVEAGRVAEAIPVLRKATQLAPDHPFAWSNLAAACLLHGDLADSIEAAGRAVRLDPGNVPARVVLGNAHAALKQPEQARRHLSAAAGLQPDNRELLIAQGNERVAGKDFEGAIACFERAVEQDPADAGTLGTLVGLLQRACRWQEAAARGAALDRLDFTDGATPAEPLLVSVSRAPDPARTHRVARAWARMIEAKMGYRAAPRRPQGPRERLCIGYLSYDFRDHAVGHLVRSLFAQHDRDRVAVVGFSYGPDDGSRYRREIAGSFDAFHDVAGLSHVAAAAAVRAAKVDVLVDLTGQTKGNRLEICALRPAPVQVTWLGFPGTTGARFMDYILGDPVVTPLAEADCYSEALAVLPDSYQANDRWQEIGRAVRRSDHGLPDAGVVFASFTNSYKIEPVIFDCWMRLLQRVPAGMLWLLSHGDAVDDRLRGAAAARGVDPARLLFARHAAKADHLARLSLADLALDTRIYNGHTTTSDCLFAGLPVVALEGSHFASRVSESLLRAIDMPGLAAPDLAGYEALAAELALDPARRAALRQELDGKRLTTALFDTARLAHNLERAYRAMWARAERGEAPGTIEVAALE